MIKSAGVAIRAALVLVLVALLQPGPAMADNYPERPVRIIVPIGAGGSYDFVGRLLANRLSELMGQSFFVENRTGGRNARRHPVGGYSPG
jgi:tripartite-type tricarboxylate transporter receptor subunit TctC